MDAAELYWAYKTWKEGEDDKYHEKYEVARFLGILIKNPKLLPRLREILPFFWEKGAPKKQSLEDMKRAIKVIAGAQGVSKTPLPKLINLRMEARKKREEEKKQEPNNKS